jgi:serine/threonine protein kinase
MRLKVVTRPAAVGTTWLDLFHPGSPSELTLDARVRVIADVTGALIQIHENGGIPRPHRRHGRLTPRHILVTVDGSACLFHVKEPFSRLLPPQPDLGYLAPELLTQSSSANQQCDVFSLGVLLWEALDNGRLFPHRRAAAISRLSSRSLPTPRASEEWALPLSDVALRALSHDPAERYADATAFWLALREHLPPPDGARNALARLVQRELKLELTSEIREAPPYLSRGLPPTNSRPPELLDLALLEPDAARYSLRPEPSSRRLSGAAPESALPDTPNPAWQLSDPPPGSSLLPNSGVVERISLTPETQLSDKAPASRPSDASVEPRHSEQPAVARAPQAREPRHAVRSPAADPALAALRASLARDLGEGAMPFFVASQPAARPFPWGALSFAALIFFGVGAAVAFGAVSALRASRADVVVRERTVVEAPAPATSAGPTRLAPPAPAPAIAPPAATPPAPLPPLVAAPEPTAPHAQLGAMAAPSKAPAARSESARRAAPRRAPKAAKPRPMPVRSTSETRPREEAPKAVEAPKSDALPFTSQPY